jgi:hypothetical protein
MQFPEFVDAVRQIGAFWAALNEPPHSISSLIRDLLSRNIPLLRSLERRQKSLTIKTLRPKRCHNRQGEFVLLRHRGARRSSDLTNGSEAATKAKYNGRLHDKTKSCPIKAFQWRDEFPRVLSARLGQLPLLSSFHGIPGGARTFTTFVSFHG